MMLLAEPTIYVYGGGVDGSYCDASFGRFWSLFERFSDLVKSNEAKLYCTTDLLEAIGRLFPYATMAKRQHQPANLVHAAASHIIRFLDKYTDRPLRDYTGQEGGATFDETHRPSGFVYRDGTVWLAWQDLVVRVGRVIPGGPRAEGSLIATDPQESCVEARARYVRLSYQVGNEVRFLVCRACDGCWPKGLIDPTVLQRLRDRRGSADPTLAYEDSGHQPPLEIKRVLGRTARDARSIVLRMNTSHYCPDAADPCKLEPHSQPNQIRFTISDGHVTFHGLFTTTAQDFVEQGVALTYVSGCFRNRCGQEKFRIGMI